MGLASPDTVASPTSGLPKITGQSVPWLGVSVDRCRGSRAWRESAVSDSYELLSWPRLSARAVVCPPSAVPGQKRVHFTAMHGTNSRWTQSFPRTWMAPRAPPASLPESDNRCLVGVRKNQEQEGGDQKACSACVMRQAEICQCGMKLARVTLLEQ